MTDSSTPKSTSDRVVAALRKVHDPEIPVNVYDLGLIYELAIQDDGKVRIEMTLTAPNCPVADQIVSDVRTAVAGVEGVPDAEVKLVFQPPWSPEKMSEVGRLELQAMGVDPDRAKQSLAKRPTSLTIGRKPTG
jgi:FeS assembly SUF system protein